MVSLALFVISCIQESRQIEKIQIEPVSLFADTAPPKLFTLTFQAKTDTALELIITIEAEEAVEPPVNVEDTIAKQGYQVEEVFIDKRNGNAFSSQIICTDRFNVITFRARAIDAIKIAKRFNAPIFADKHFLTD